MLITVFLLIPSTRAVPRMPLLLIAISTTCAFRDIDPDSGETRLYCYSEQKAQKERAMRNRFHKPLEAALTQLQADLTSRGTVKN